MVTGLAHSPQGRQYLAQQGVMDKISNIILGAQSDPFSSFYLPGATSVPPCQPLLLALVLGEMHSTAKPLC